MKATFPTKNPLSNTVELGVVIGKHGREISQANAETHIAGYSTSLGGIHVLT